MGSIARQQAWNYICERANKMLTIKGKEGEEKKGQKKKKVKRKEGREKKGPEKKGWEKREGEKKGRGGGKKG